MSDTPITDKKAIDITGGLYGVTHLRRNPKGKFVRVNFARQLERENAALREAFAKAELLSDPAVAEGHYEYVEVWGYFRPNEIAVVIDRAAFNAARKEAKP